MFACITLTATEGPLQGQEFQFAARTLCTVGRSSDCFLQLPATSDLTVSRRHCLLDIDPPTVSVCDLGSLNGTQVNGQDIGHRPKGTAPEDGAPADPPAVELHEGDRLRVGSSLFVVHTQAWPDVPDDYVQYQESGSHGEPCAVC